PLTAARRTHHPTSISTTRTPVPEVHARSIPPHAQRPTGPESVTRAPQLRHCASPSTSTISSFAPSASVPSAATSKQNLPAPGSTVDSLPISIMILRIGSPSAFSSATETIAVTIPSSCTSHLDDPAHERHRVRDGRRDRRREPHSFVERGWLTGDDADRR